MAILEFLMRWRTPIGEQLALAVSYLGTPFAILGFIAWYTLNHDKRSGYGMCISFFLSGIICQGTKVIFRIPRPWILVSDTSRFYPVAAAVSTATGYSFPSIHTQGTAVFSEGLFYASKKKLVRVLSILFLVAVGFSRMYLGCHTLKDVLTAAAVATGFSAIVFPIWNSAGKNRHNDGIFAFGLVGFALILLFLVLAFTAMETVEFVHAKDGFETAGAAIGFSLAFLWERRSIRYQNGGVGIGAKVLRFLIGLAGVLLIEFGLKAINDTQALLLVLRYALMLFWLFGMTPFLSVKLGLAKQEH